MTIDAKQWLKGKYTSTRALSDKVINSDCMLVIEGFETLKLLVKQMPVPIISTAGEIEVPTPNGAKLWQPQQLKVHQQGAVTLMETRIGHMDTFFDDIAKKADHTRFNATVYEGTDDRFRRAWKIIDAFIVLDNPDRDWDNDAQILTYSGTMFFHYFGETVAGNIDSID
jgi:hypothetical protein